MKAIKRTLALCALATLTQAQPYTGQSYYNHSGGAAALLTSGAYAQIYPGFLMGGHVPSISSSSDPNFYVIKTDIDGKFNGNPGEFSNEYFFYDGGQNCLQDVIQAHRCYGLSLTETNGASGVNYGLAAAFDAGCLFAVLDNTGAVLTEALLQFPQGALPNTKPLIAFSASTGNYYVSGSYAIGTIDYMYVFCITPSGSGVWDLLFDVGNTGNKIVEPGAMITDTYPGSAQLDIVGVYATNPAVDADAFFLALDAGTGAINWREGFGSFINVNESFSSIALANANNGGYILGGSVDWNPTGGHAWMVNLKSNGTINWSNVINPSTDVTAGNVVGVGERYSNAYSAYEYYGATVANGANGGMMVLKLDAFGNPFSANHTNEFVYNDNLGNQGQTSALTLLDAGLTGDNTGVHVFGNITNGPSDFFLNQACFNGATGSCNSTSQQNLTQMININHGPAVVYTSPLNLSKGLPFCPNHRLIPISINDSPNQPCSMNSTPTSPYTGDNNRTAQPTGIAENTSNKSRGLSVYPNPASATAEIRYTLDKDGAVCISLTDILGKQVKTLYAGYKNAGANALTLDLTTLGIQEGVYIVNVTSNGVSSQQKIIFNKN